MTKKIILWLMTACLVLPSLPVMAQGDNSDEIFIDFSENGGSNKLGVVSGMDIDYVTREGVRLANISTDEGQLVFDIDDGTIRNPAEKAIEITVEYLDEGLGYFVIGYDGTTGDGISEPVLLDNSGEWRTRTFRLYDAAAGNHFYGGDFAVQTWTSRYGYARSPMLLKKVTVKRLRQKPVDISVSSKRAGNVFVNGEDIKIDVKFKNVLNKYLDLNINYTVKDAISGEEMWKGSDGFKIGAKTPVERTVDIPMDKFGLYELEIEATDADEKYSIIDSYKFSHSVFNEDAPLNDRFGTCTHFAYRDSAAVSPLIAAAGIGYIRDEVRWADYELTKGKYRMPERERIYLDNVEKSGLDKLVILAFYNPLYQEEQMLPKTEEELKAFGDYCYNLVKELGDSCNLYEVWNEPNLWTFSHDTSPDAYVPALKVAYENVKKANPNAVVLGCATAGISLDYYKRVFELGGADYMDELSLHYYFLDNKVMDDYVDLYNRLMEVDKLIEAYNPSLKITVSEYGWTTNPTGEYIKKDNLLKNMTIFRKIPRVDKTFWYEFQDSGSSLFDTERMFGFVTYWEEKNPYAADPIYLAAAAYNYIIGAADMSDMYEEDNTYVYRFKKNYRNNDTMMMWCEGGSDLVALRLNCDSVTVYDSYGNGTQVYGDNGVFSFLLGDTPVMVEGSFNDYQIVQADVKLETSIDVAPEEIISYTPELPEGYKIEYTAEEDVEILNTENNDLQFKVNGNVGHKTFISLKITYNGKFITEGQIRVAVQESVTAEIMPLSYFDKNKNVLCLKIKNNRRDSAISGSFRLTEPRKFADKLTPIQFKDIAAMSEGKFYMYLPEFDGGGYFNFKGEFDIDGYDSVAVSCKYDRSSSKKCDSPPVIDGVISPGEYSDECMLRTVNENVDNLFDNAIRDEKDLSGKYFVTYDDEKIYIAAEVTDDVHYQVEDEGMMWRGDCIQFALADRDAAPVKSIEVMISKRGSTIQTSGYINKDYPMEVAIERSGTKTVYEIAIPFAGVFGEDWNVNDRKSIGFSMLANDNDGPDKRSFQAGRKGWIEYGSGIGRVKSTSLYADLRLKE